MLTAKDIAVPPGSPLDLSNARKQEKKEEEKTKQAAAEKNARFSATAPVEPAAPNPGQIAVASEKAKVLVIDQLVSQAVVDQDTTTNGSLDRVREQYRIVRKLFGGEHALLTAGVYVGARCNKDDGKAHSLFGDTCGRESRAGIAGIVMVPLLGAGGGHGLTFWPAVQTDDELQAFLKFQQSLQLHGEALAATFAAFEHTDTSVPDAAVLAARVRTFRESLKEEFQREVDTQGSHAKLAKKFLACLAQVESANLGLQLEWDTLSRLWREYGGIVENTDTISRRHNLLVGPFIGAPITEDPTKVVIYGLGTELGAQGFRVTLGGGLTADYSANLVPITGWVATVGLSGQWGDDLLHYLNGAKDLANGLKKVTP